MSKLTKATKVYRGVSDMALPMEFLQPNEFGVRGGVEAGFMSTTRDRGVAITYAGETGIGVVFEVQMGMVDRGGDIGWLSQYPHEKEILFGPLSGLEVMAVRTSGMLVVVEAKLSVNLSALTLEQVVAKRQKMVRDMCLQLEFGVQHGIAKDAGGVWTKFFESSALNKSRTLEFLRSWLRSHQDLEADYYNDDASFGHAIEEAVHAAKCVAVWPNKFAQLPIEWKARLGETMESDEPHQAPEEEDLVLAMDHKAHGCVEGVAALLLASDGLKALKLRNANLSAPEVVTVVEAVHHSSCRSSLQRLVLSGNHFDVRGARALARFLAEATAMRELELDEANLTFLGHYSGFQEFCVVLQVNKTLQVLRWAHLPRPPARPHAQTMRYAMHLRVQSSSLLDSQCRLACPFMPRGPSCSPAAFATTRWAARALGTWPRLSRRMGRSQSSSACRGMCPSLALRAFAYACFNC